jgi:hypothetical protein
MAQRGVARSSSSSSGDGCDSSTEDDEALAIPVGAPHSVDPLTGEQRDKYGFDRAGRAARERLQKAATRGE